MPTQHQDHVVVKAERERRFGSSRSGRHVNLRQYAKKPSLAMSPAEQPRQDEFHLALNAADADKDMPTTKVERMALSRGESFAGNLLRFVEDHERAPEAAAPLFSGPSAHDRHRPTTYEENAAWLTRVEQMVSNGETTMWAIQDGVRRVVEGTGCAETHARRLLVDNKLSVEEAIRAYVKERGDRALFLSVAAGAGFNKATLCAQAERVARKEGKPLQREQALCLAAARGHVAAMTALLDEGVSPDAHDPVGGYTALHYAAEYNQVAALELLIERGADLEKKDEWGQMTAYCWAAHVGSAAAVEALLHAGCRMAARDVIGKAGTDHARVRQHEDVSYVIGIAESQERLHKQERLYRAMLHQPDVSSCSAPKNPQPFLFATINQEEKAAKAAAAFSAAGIMGTEGLG